MSKLTLDDFPLGEWVEHDTAACPGCLGKVEIRRVLRVSRVGTFSLAGVGLKFLAREVWEFRCRRCGAHGPTALK